MKKTILYAIVSVLCLLVAVLAWAERPDPDADALWTYITRAFRFFTWGFWPDHQGMQEGTYPMGRYLRCM